VQHLADLPLEFTKPTDVPELLDAELLQRAKSPRPPSGLHDCGDGIDKFAVARLSDLSDRVRR
jgi:hypothetical protein